MDGVQPHITMRTSFILLLLSLLHMSNGNLCSAPETVEFPENNNVDDVVANIIVQPGVTLEFTPGTNNIAFKLRGNQLLAAVVFDYETERSEVASITCTDTASGSTFKIVILVFVQNLNDNAPGFAESLYQVNVSETSPVGKIVGHFAATDPDQPPQLFYTLTSESENKFELSSPTTPDLVIRSPLDYDTVKIYRMVLYVQDTPLTVTDNTKSKTGSTTIVVTVTDADNRPPWFQPCTRQMIGATLICQSDGYNGRVILNELETGPLQLKPGPVYATDGDTGINEAITYSFLSGANTDLFTINPNTGNISMVKPAKSLDAIHLIVLAAQRDNSHQFATTTVTISVQAKSLHPPQFEKPAYKGTVSSLGAMAVDGDKLLYIHATDKDYNEVPNPHIVYTIKGSSDFSLLNGYLVMNKDLPPTILSLQVVATDTSNNESDTAELTVQVKSGFTSTTSFPMSTTNIMTTTPIVESTTSTSRTTTVAIASTTPNVPTTSSIATTIPSTSASILSTTTLNVPTTSSITTTIRSTSASTLSTTHPSTSTTTEGSVSTTNASMTSEGSTSTASTAPPPTVVIASGLYGPEDMAALGATLGVLLLVCLVVILVLSLHLRKGETDWKKIYEVSVFRSSLGQSSGDPKKGIQYTNEAFQSDEDGGSTLSGGPGRRMSMEAIVTLPLHALLPDNTSEVGSDRADNEKEVKPILTKERRNEEGYKAVWFKEDIDPNAKEEVVIIPDRREEDSYEEDEPANKTQIGSVDDADSGLGVKVGDLPEDSEDHEATTSDL